MQARLPHARSAYDAHIEENVVCIDAKVVGQRRTRFYARTHHVDQIRPIRMRSMEGNAKDVSEPQMTGQCEHEVDLGTYERDLFADGARDARVKDRQQFQLCHA